METSDKTLALAFLSLKRFGLTGKQLMDIEAVMDGMTYFAVPRSGELSPAQIARIEETLAGEFDVGPAVITYEDAASRFGLRAKNRARTIGLWVKKGQLEAAYGSGQRAIGVTMASVKAKLEADRARRCGILGEGVVA